MNKLALERREVSGNGGDNHDQRDFSVQFPDGVSLGRFLTGVASEVAGGRLGGDLRITPFGEDGSFVVIGTTDFRNLGAMVGLAEVANNPNAGEMYEG